MQSVMCSSYDCCTLLPLAFAAMPAACPTASTLTDVSSPPTKQELNTIFFDDASVYPTIPPAKFSENIEADST